MGDPRERSTRVESGDLLGSRGGGEPGDGGRGGRPQEAVRVGGGKKLRGRLGSNEPGALLLKLRHDKEAGRLGSCSGLEVLSLGGCSLEEGGLTAADVEDVGVDETRVGADNLGLLFSRGVNWGGREGNRAENGAGGDLDRFRARDVVLVDRSGVLLDLHLGVVAVLVSPVPGDPEVSVGVQHPVLPSDCPILPGLLVARVDGRLRSVDLVAVRVLRVGVKRLRLGCLDSNRQWGGLDDRPGQDRLGNRLDKLGDNGLGNDGGLLEDPDKLLLGNGGGVEEGKRAGGLVLRLRGGEDVLAGGGGGEGDRLGRLDGAEDDVGGVGGRLGCGGRRFRGAGAAVCGCHGHGAEQDSKEHGLQVIGQKERKERSEVYNDFTDQPIETLERQKLQTL